MNSGADEVISIRERSATPISAKHYRALEPEPHFWALVDSGIVSLERSRLSRYAIRAGAFVGQAVVGDLILRVTEKIEGALAPLLLFPDQPDVKVLECESFADRRDLIIRALVDKFLDLLDAYLRIGRLKTYDKCWQMSALPRGKIAVAKTMRRWASGRRDQVVYTVDNLSPRVLLNQLIGFALNLIDPMIRGASSDPERRKRIRTAALLFEDSDWQSLTRTTPEWIDRRYASAGYATSSFAGLASLARLFSLHFGAATTTSEERLKYAWFVNLETLFEECVRRSTAMAAANCGLLVTDWRRKRFFVFPTNRKYRAEPDLVVWRGQTPIAVLDAKYKDLEGRPSSPDVYQLTAHANAWHVQNAALIYPAANTTVRRLGVAADSVSISSMTFDVLHPVKSGREILDKIVASPNELSTAHHVSEAFRTDASVPTPIE